MATNRFFNGPSKNYKDDRGKTNLIPSAVVGVVKHNIDPKKSGQLKVFLKRLDAGDENNPDNWTTVDYLSPFFGSTPNTGSSDSEYGTFKDNPQSYGFWFTPPDIGTEVVCLFNNGVSNFGWYIGSIPTPGTMHMVPAIGSSQNIVPGTEAEAKNYGGATLLPVGEINNKNSGRKNDPQMTDQPRPIHSIQAAILNNQGLIRDPDRGTISSSSSRESPSKVFGISTPGRPIYEGGYDDSTIMDAVKDSTIPATNFKVVGRRGGHTIVMDDGDLQGKDQLLRFRTAAGHMIMMNDTIGTFFIIHASGKSYIEMGKEGTIDMYSTNSVNIRTQGDLNLHADNNININAKKDLNISAENINIESFQATNQFTGTNFSQQTKGDHTLKVDSKMTFESASDSMIKSGGTNYVKGGPNVKLNTGESSLIPQEVKAIPKVAHTDTLFDKEKGYMSAPAKLPSIVSRAPAHSPWANANQGVNVKTDLGADNNLPPAPSPAVASVNESSSAGSNAVSATVTQTATVPGNSENNALISQMAVNAQANDQKAGLNNDQVSALQADVKNVDGTKVPVIGDAKINPYQLQAAGYIKPGTADAMVAGTTKGLGLKAAMPDNWFTGKDGVKSVGDLVNNTPAQVNVLDNVLDKAKTSLVSAGAITGKESPGQIGGLVVATAQSGTKSAVDFLKTASSATNTASPLSSANAGTALAAGAALLASKGISIPSGVSGMSGSIKDAISSGNKAADGVEKAAGPLSGAQIADNLKGAVSSAFDAVKKGFKALTVGKPQSLTAINAANAEEKAAKDAGEQMAADSAAPKLPESNSLTRSLTSLGDKIKTAISAKSPSGMENLPGGAALAGNVINTTGVSSNPSDSVPVTGDPYAGLTPEQIKSLGKADPTDPYIRANLGLPTLAGTKPLPSGDLSSLSKIPGLGGVAGMLSSIKSSITGGGDKLSGTISALKDKSTSQKKLTEIAGDSLSPGESAKLNAALSSLPTGGSPISLPTVGKDTFDVSAMLSQSSSLLGDAKIPGVNLGGGLPPGAFKMPTAAQAKEYDKLKAEKTKQEDLQWDLRKKYFELKKKNGEEDSSTVAAKEEWQTCVKRIEEIKGEMYTNTTGSPAPNQMPPPDAPVDVNQKLTVASGMQPGGAGRQAVEDIGASFKNLLR